MIDPQLFGISIILAIISIGLGVASYIMAQAAMKGSDTPDMEYVQTLAKRGSLLPLLIGRRLVAPQFTFVRKLGLVWGDDTGWTKRQTGWHHIAVGPAKAIHNITIDGEYIQLPNYPGTPGSGGLAYDIFPLTPDTHPSGTSFFIPQLGTAYIFWGEVDQPIDDSAGGGLHGAANSLPIELGGDPNADPPPEIASRWPHVCSIYYTHAPHEALWPDIKYETEAEVQGGLLSLTPAHIEQSYSTVDYIERFPSHHGSDCILIGDSGYWGSDAVLLIKLWDAFTTGAWGQAGLGDPFADATWIPRTGDKFKVAGVSALDANAVYTMDRVGWHISGDATFGETYLVIHMESIDLAGATVDVPNAFAHIYQPGNDDGYNMAHIIGQLLFADFPHGLKQEQSLYDIDSLEDLGVLCHNERLAGNVIAREGQTVESLVDALLGDIGCFLPLDPYTGKYKFVPVRHSTSTSIPHIGPNHLLPPEPEIASVHRVKASERVVYVFADRDNMYKDMTIGGYDNNGAMQYQELARAKKVPLTTVNDFTTARLLANRRSQEDLGTGAAIKIMASREARLMTPGRLFSVEDVPQILLCLSTEAKPLDEAVTITAVDSYHAAVADTSTGSGGGGPGGPPPPPLPDLYDLGIEVPMYLLPYGPQSLVVPRIRAHTNITSAAVWISEDNTSYRFLAEERNAYTGGLLTSDFNETDAWYTELGPTFTEIGVDLLARAANWSSDWAKWRRGAQLLVINDEIMFCRNIEYVATDVWQLRGILRAKYNTVRGAHEAGDPFFLFNIDHLTQFTDPLLAPGRKIWLKVQPRSEATYVPLESCPALEIDLYGNSLVPQRPSGLRVVGNNNYYISGTDIDFKWAYVSGLLTGTGAGTVNAGAATGSMPPFGSFELTVLDTSDNTKGTYTNSDETWSYTDASLYSDFSSSYPSAFKLQLRNVNGGFKSDPYEITVERVT